MKPQAEIGVSGDRRLHFIMAALALLIASAALAQGFNVETKSAQKTEVTPKLAVSLAIYMVHADSETELKVSSANSRFDGLVGTFGGVDTVKIGPVELDLEHEMPRWNGTTEPPPSVEVISMPRVVTFNGEKAMVRSGRAVPYMEAGEDGCLQVRYTDPENSPVMVVSIVPSLVGNETDAVDLNFDFKLTVMGPRKAVEGVPFDVGKPVMGTREARSEYRVQQGHWNLLIRSLLAGDDEQGDKKYLIVLVRVDPVASAGPGG